MTLPVLDSGLPTAVTSHKSGGRDQWSPPLERAPDDPDAALWRCLDEVLDPELPVSLVELGLVYGASMDGATARIDLTFTATACPCMEFIREDVRDRLLQESWIEAVQIREVWDPPWTTERITPRGRERLRTLGVGAA
ncbi:MAG: metal-sulfur cluster assembly factor [Longimicrobiales bacterium]|nr:metal-sulfur cluster assembly factor [Longimicrobiales bacterium]